MTSRPMVKSFSFLLILAFILMGCNPSSSIVITPTQQPRTIIHIPTNTPAPVPQKSGERIPV